MNCSRRLPEPAGLRCRVILDLTIAANLVPAKQKRRRFSKIEQKVSAQKRRRRCWTTTRGVQVRFADADHAGCSRGGTSGHPHQPFPSPASSEPRGTGGGRSSSVDEVVGSPPPTGVKALEPTGMPSNPTETGCEATCSAPQSIADQETGIDPWAAEAWAVKARGARRPPFPDQPLDLLNLRPVRLDEWR
jgi:hypothetical protein